MNTTKVDTILTFMMNDVFLYEELNKKFSKKTGVGGYQKEETEMPENKLETCLPSTRKEPEL